MALRSFAALRPASRLARLEPPSAEAQPALFDAFVRLMPLGNRARGLRRRPRGPRGRRRADGTRPTTAPGTRARRCPGCAPSTSASTRCAPSGPAAIPRAGCACCRPSRRSSSCCAAAPARPAYAIATAKDRASVVRILAAYGSRRPLRPAPHPRQGDRRLEARPPPPSGPRPGPALRGDHLRRRQGEPPAGGGDPRGALRAGGLGLQRPPRARPRPARRASWSAPWKTPRRASSGPRPRRGTCANLP